MDKSEFLELNLPSRDNTTDIADVNAISDNFKIIDSAFLDLVEEKNLKFQTKANINLNFDDNSTNEEQYPSVPAVVNFTNRKIDPLKIVNSASGNAIALKDSANDKLVNLKLFGKTTQNGTPTPTEPKELKSVGDSGSFEVGVYGKNFLENTFASHTVNGVAITNNGDGSVTLNGTATENSISTLGYIPQKLGSDFVLSGVKGSVVLYATYTKNGVYVSETWNTSGGTSLRDDIEYDKVSISVYVAKGVTCNNVTVYPMVRHKSYNSEFEQGKTPQSLTIPYTLRSVGDIKDEVDFNRGVKTQRFNVVDMSTLTWQYTDYGYWKTASLKEKILIDYEEPKILTTNYPTNSWSGKNYDEQSITQDALGQVIVMSLDDTTSPTGTLIYALATPIETPLTETELNDYRHLMTNKGTTTILSEADMEVSYVADTKLYIDNKIAELTALTLEV